MQTLTPIVFAGKKFHMKEISIKVKMTLSRRSKSHFVFVLSIKKSPLETKGEKGTNQYHLFLSLRQHYLDQVMGTPKGLMTGICHLSA